MVARQLFLNVAPVSSRFHRCLVRQSCDPGRFRTLVAFDVRHLRTSCASGTRRRGVREDLIHAFRGLDIEECLISRVGRRQPTQGRPKRVQPDAA